VKAGWEVKPLGKVCELKPPKKLAKAALAETDLVSFAGMSELSELQADFKEAEARPLSMVYSGYTYFADGDVLVAKITPCFENGKMGIARNLTSGIGFGSSEFVPLRTNGEIVPEFLFYYLLRDRFRTDGAKVMSGAVGHKRVPHDYFLELLTPIPPLEEQKQIVAVLDAAFEGLTRAKENAEANLQNARDLFESGLETQLENSNAEMTEHSFGDTGVLQIIDGDRGKAYPKKTDFKQSGHCLFLSTANVRSDGFKFDNCQFITKEKDAELRKGKLCKRDVVLTTRGTIGHIGLFDEGVPFDEIRINSGMLILRPNEERLLADYLFEIFRSRVVREQIEKETSGAAQPQLPIRTLKELRFSIPRSLKEQANLVSGIKEHQKSCAELLEHFTTKLTDIADLRQSLLQKAFAGELT
jgi:type I restriction enzyme S subunit